MIPPVEVPVIRSKCSTTLRPVARSKVANADDANAPTMPPPSRLRMRKVCVMIAHPSGCLLVAFEYPLTSSGGSATSDIQGDRKYPIRRWLRARWSGTTMKGTLPNDSESPEEIPGSQPGGRPPGVKSLTALSVGGSSIE